MIYKTYSERRREAAGTLDVFQYEEVPQRLRVQIQQVLRDALGPHVTMGCYETASPNHNSETWCSIHKVICKEIGVHSLCHAETEGQEVIGFLGSCTAAQFVDIVELCVRVIDRHIREWSSYDLSSHGIEQKPDEALAEINYRFRQSGFGFQFHNGEAFRIDSEFLHEEVVKPALRILTQSGFDGARDEFLSAHRHYRNGDHEEAITEVAKAFESTLKIVCDQRRWEYDSGSRATDLLKIVRSKELWPQHLDGSFDQLLATLASGLPKVRNGQGAHGQGSSVRATPPYIAAYALHLAAAKIVFVAEAAGAMTDKAPIAA